MSRTYRLRHLPKIRSKKFGDAACRSLRDRQDEMIEARLEEHFGMSCREYYRKHGFGVWYELRNQLEKELVRPIAPKHHHPWVGWGMITTIKVWYRSNGNRRVRRRNKQMCKLVPHDETYDNRPRHRFFDRQDGWDKWDLC